MFRRIVVWKHGLIILLFYGGLGTAIGFVSIGVPVFLIGGLLGVSVQRLAEIVWGSSIIWLPYCVGLLARETNSEGLRDGDYDELHRER
jgi:hypothetical protein